MKRLIVANWKMNPQSPKDAERIFGGIRRTAVKLKKIETVICPPFVYLSLVGIVGNRVSDKRLSFSLGAQDLFWENPPAGKGSYTGEISAEMLKRFAVKYVIVGHSERRRHLGETNEIINRKIKTALKAGLRVIFCVGEKERNPNEDYLRFVKEEVIAGLKGIQRKFLGKLIVAYEPIWAIGKKGSAADAPEDILQMVLYIRRILLLVTDKDSARVMPILYGGSVVPKNAESFLRNAGIQGLLIGHESLIPKDFNEILRIAEKIKTK